MKTYAKRTQADTLQHTQHSFVCVDVSIHLSSAEPPRFVNHVKHSWHECSTAK